MTTSVSDYITGLKAGLGDKAASMIVGEVSYELTDPTIDSQIVKLKSLGADLFFDASTPKFAAQAIKKIADLGWKPVHILDINASPVSAHAQAGRPRYLQGHHRDQLRQGPGRPAVEGRRRYEEAYFAFMDKYYPEGDKNSIPSTPMAIDRGVAGYILQASAATI